MALVIRSAERTAADALRFSRGLDEATDGLMTRMLGARVHDIISRVALREGHDWSLTHVRVAESDGQPVGMLSGMPAEVMGDPLGALAEEAGWRMLRAGAIALTIVPTLRALGRHEPGEWYVQAVAVDGSARGLGVGSALLADAEARAAQVGSRVITLDVAATNTGGRRLYERLGYTEQWTAPGSPLLRRMAVHRMRRALPGS